MRPPLHYCFLSFGSWEGNASLVRPRELGAELLRRGVRVTYLVDDVPYNRHTLKLPVDAAIEWISPKGLRQFSARRRALRRIRPDYVHILNPSPKSYLTFRLFPSQKLVCDWDEWVAMKPLGAWRHLRDGLIDRFHRRRASHLVVASRYMQSQFASRFGREPLYLPYATYLEEKPDLPSPYAAPTAVYMGNLNAGYDHDLIFHAAVKLQARGLHPRIEFLGKGLELDRWRQFVLDHKLTNVNVAGFITGDDLWARLRHAHVLLFPIRPTIPNLSRCPSKTYAYAQARRPVITCRVGEVPTVLEEKAIYIDTTADAFADALAEAMSAPPLPDVNYHLEQHNWRVRAETLLNALGAPSSSPSLSASSA